MTEKPENNAFVSRIDRQATSGYPQKLKLLLHFGDFIRWLKHDYPMFLECQNVPLNTFDPLSLCDLNDGALWEVYFSLSVLSPPSPAANEPVSTVRWKFPAFSTSSQNHHCGKLLWNGVISHFFQMWRCFSVNQEKYLKDKAKIEKFGKTKVSKQSKCHTFLLKKSKTYCELIARSMFCLPISCLSDHWWGL